MNYIYLNLSVLCHSLFAMSLARSSFCGRHSMSLTHAACDQPLMNSPITKLKFCHSIFAKSLTRFAFRNPNGITCGYAAFDLLLQNSSITKRCFVILSKVKNLLFLHISLLLRSLTLAPSGVDRWFAALQDDRYAIIVLCSLHSVLCYLYLAFLRSLVASLCRDDRYAIIVLCWLRPSCSRSA